MMMSWQLAVISRRMSDRHRRQYSADVLSFLILIVCYSLFSASHSIGIDINLNDNSTISTNISNTATAQKSITTFITNHTNTDTIDGIT